MPFIIIEPTMGRQRGDTAPYVGMSTTRNNAKSELGVVITLSSHVCEEMGWDRNKMKITVGEGVGADANSFMLSDAKGGNGYILTVYEQISTRSTRITVSRLKHYDVVPHESHRITECVYSVDKQAGILVQVPEWLKYRGQFEVVTQRARGKR